MKYKFLLLTVLCLGLAILAPNFVLGSEPSNSFEAVNLYFFYANTCPHCHEEATYLAKLKSELGDKLNIISYELTENEANVKLLEKFGQRFNLDLGQMPVPETFIGDKSFVGYGSEEIDGANIKNAVKQCLKLACHDVGQEIINAKDDASKAKNNTFPVIIIVVVIIFIVGLVLINRNKD
ncbi:MAG TPA: hypothetical protein PLK76_02620 [bacterium]|nr:hypothetical protein [bacterium]